MFKVLTMILTVNRSFNGSKLCKLENEQFCNEKGKAPSFILPQHISFAKKRPKQRFVV